MKNNLIRKKPFKFIQYTGTLFLVFCMVLLMKMDVNAEIVDVKVNITYFVDDLLNKGLHFTVPSSGRIRFYFDHCTDPNKVKIYDFDDQEVNYYRNENNYFDESHYREDIYIDGYDSFGIYWKTGLENRNSNWFTVEQGDHFARMRNRTVNSEATFIIQYEPAENYNGEIEQNDSFDLAVEMELNKQYWGNLLHYYDDIDYYHFALNAPSKVDFSFMDTWNNRSFVDTDQLWYPDSSGGVTLYYEDQRTNMEEIGELICPETMRLDAGNYYIRINSSKYFSAPEYILMVNVTEESASEYEQERNNFQSQANEKEVNKNYTGNINQYRTYYENENEDVDWFKFTIGENSYLKLELTVPRQAEGSVTAKLYKDNQELCKLESEDEDEYHSYIESEEQIFPAGVYYVCVSSDDANWDYKICLSQRAFVSVTNIEIISRKSLKVGESAAFSAVVKPDNASRKTVRWISAFCAAERTSVRLPTDTRRRQRTVV